MPDPIHTDQIGNRVQIYSNGLFHHGTIASVTMGVIKLNPYLEWNSVKRTYNEVNDPNKFASIPNFPVPPVVPITEEHYQNLLDQKPQE